MTQGERIAVMENRLAQLEKTVGAIDAKMDELLALRQKGAGVFWLASVLFGTSLAALMTYVASWFRG